MKFKHNSIRLKSKQARFVRVAIINTTLAVMIIGAYGYGRVGRWQF